MLQIMMRATSQVMRKPILPVMLAVFGLLGTGAAYGETFDQLTGLSIVVRYQQRAEYRDPGGGPLYTITEPKLIRAYIGAQGRIFENTLIMGSSYRVVALGKAAEWHQGRMLFTWAMIDGHLTRIVQEVEGLVTETFTVDPAALTCAFEQRMEPDPKTQRVVGVGTDQRVYEFPHLTVVSSDCSVKRGNIFASE